MKKEVNRTNVAKKLIKLRTEKGLTSKQVAEAVGINHDAYRRYETTVVPPSKNLLKLANFYNVSLDYLTDREEEPFKDDYVHEEMLNNSGLLTMRNQNDYQVTDNDLGELTETEIILIRKFRAVSDKDKVDVAKYLNSKKDEE